MERMIQYERFYITCTSRKKEDRQIYKQFQERLRRYSLNEEMRLYKVPLLTEEYQYAHELSLKYSWDWTRDDDREDFPGLYIDEEGMIETEYSKADFQQAAAYLVNFWYIAYTYDDLCSREFVDVCCKNHSWKYEIGLIQNKGYQLPSAEFKKKKYASLEIGYAFDQEVVALLIENGLAKEEDFLPVTNKKKGIVCYQLQPQNIVRGFAQDNDMVLVDRCSSCGLERYQNEEEPFYISKATLNQLKGLNRTKEVYGSYLELDKVEKRKEMSNGVLEPWYIVNKEVYVLLHKHYPRMQFIPIFPQKEKA